MSQEKIVSRSRLFIENFFIYGIGSVLNKAVPFLLLPVLTRMITDPAVFGVFDIYTIVIRLVTPFVILGCYDAMFRLFFEDDATRYRQEVCSSSLTIVAAAAGISLLTAFLLWFSGFSFVDRHYRWLIPVGGLVIASQGIQSIVAAPTRMQNHRRVVILLSLFGAVLYYGFAILLAWRGRPLEGLVYGNLFSGLFLLAVYALLNRSFFSFNDARKERVWELLKIGAPLAPTFLIYWIFQSCDRFMIGHMLGLEAVGLYGIGARLSSISQGIYMAFAGGWQYFAFSTMKDKDHTQLMSRVFEVLGILSIASLMLLLPLAEWLFGLMVGGHYRQAYVVFPFLFISPLLLMLSQIAGTQLQVIKKTYLSTATKILGAVANILLNLIFIPRWGILGAAMATFLGYVIMTVSVVLFVVRMQKLELSVKFVVLSVCGTVFLLAYPLLDAVFRWTSYLLFPIFVFSYRKEIIIFFQKRRGAKNNG